MTKNQRGCFFIETVCIGNLMNTTSQSTTPKVNHNTHKTTIQRVQLYSLTFCIRHVSCHSNETHALIANPPKSTQLEGNPHHSPKLHAGVCSSVECGAGQRDTDTHTDDRGQCTFRLAKCNKNRPKTVEVNVKLLIITITLTEVMYITKMQRN